VGITRLLTLEFLVGGGHVERYSGPSEGTKPRCKMQRQMGPWVAGLLSLSAVYSIIGRDAGQYLTMNYVDSSRPGVSQEQPAAPVLVVYIGYLGMIGNTSYSTYTYLTGLVRPGNQVKITYS
jgi:hypothetical protein